MNRSLSLLRRLQPLAERSDLLTLVIIADVVGYFGGLLYWYGAIMGDPTVPIWSWPFIPDCPLFGLLGGLALLMVIARKRWTESAQRRGQRLLVGLGLLFLLFWVAGYWGGTAEWWQRQTSLFGLLSWVLLLYGLLFRQAPSWLLAISAMGQIKYGVWTVTAWLVFWRNTALLYGAPLYTIESIFMTATHIGLLAQGIFLLTYFVPSRWGTTVALLWFALSDFVDYGLGYFPPLPREIPLAVMQWSTIGMTGLLSVWFVLLQRDFAARGSQPAGPLRNQSAAGTKAVAGD